MVGDSSAALDFADDAPQSDILPLLSEQLGQAAESVEQGGGMEAPQDPMQEPAPIAPDLQVAPPMPVAAPRTAPRMMHPQEETQAAENDYAQSQSDYTAANNLARKAAAENAQVQQQDAAEAQPFLDETANLERDKQIATQQATDFLTTIQQQALADTDANIKNELEHAKVNPNDWFGNHTTEQGIAAVVGMIGAGFAGKSASGFVDGLINRDIAEYNRKGESLALIRQLTDKRYSQGRQMYSDRTTAIETRHLAALGYVKARLEAKRNQTANKRIQANYDKGIAELDMKFAEGVEKLNNQKITTRIHQEQNAIDIARLGLQQREAAARQQQQQGKEDKSVPFNIARAIDPSGPKGVPLNLSIPVKKKVDTAVVALNSTKAIREAIERFRGDREGLLHALKTSEPFRNQLYAASRDISGAGANLTGPEKPQVDGMAIVMKDLLAGELGGVDELDKLASIEEMLANSASQAVLSNNDNLEINPDSIVGQVMSRKAQREQKDNTEAAEVDETLAKKAPGPAQMMALKVLAHKGNKAAQAKLQKLQAGGFIAKGLRALHIGGMNN